MFSHFDFDVIIRTAPYLLLVGLRFTLTLTIVATFFGVILGTLLALMRLSGSRALGAIATCYVDVIRALPFVLVIFWFYFLVPYIGQAIFRTAEPVQVGGLASAIITFSLFEAAFFAEIVRAGIQSVSKGQANAAYALGLSYRQVMGSVILPQAFRNMLPLILTQIIVLFQDTTLCYVIGLTDLLGAANQVAQRDNALVEMYIFAAILYFIISFVASRAARRLQTHIAIVR